MIQKIILILVLIGIVLAPVSENLKLQKAAALNIQNAIDWDGNGKISDFEQTLTTAGAFLVVSCSPIGRITGLDKITDFVANALGKAIKKAGESIAGALGIPTSFGELEEELGEELGEAVSGDVPVNVTNFSDEAGKKVTAIAEANKISADQTAKTSKTGLCNEVNKLFNGLVKQVILGKIHGDLLDWIERGGKGPVIVNNWEEFLTDAGKNAIGDLAKEVGLKFLCTPFNFQVKIILAEPQRFTSRVTCTMEDIRVNIQNFYNDFRNGGWIAYQRSWEPQNNIFGLALMTVDEAAKREDAAKTAAQNDALAGLGFLSKKNCVTVTLPGGGTRENCIIATAGSTVKDAATAVLINTPLSSVLSQDELGGFVGSLIDAAINKIVTFNIGRLQKGFQKK